VVGADDDATREYTTGKSLNFFPCCSVCTATGYQSLLTHAEEGEPAAFADLCFLASSAIVGAATAQE